MHDPILREPRTVGHGVLLRPIRPTDDPAIARIIRAAMAEFRAGKGFATDDKEIDRMSRSYLRERAMYYVVEDGGRVLGGAGIAPLEGADADSCELRKMYLNPAGRNRGLGRALMDRCLDAARRLGYRRVLLETLDSMYQARALYARFGFSLIDKPAGVTGQLGCDRWFLKVLDAGFPPIGEGERWVDL
jgi:putative acetyltransferase